MSIYRVGPVLLLHYPERARASYPRASEWWGQLCMALGFQGSYEPPHMVTQAIDIITDPSYSRNTDSDMVFGSSLAQMSPWP